MLLDNLNLKESMLIIPINPNTVDKIRKLKQIEYAWKGEKSLISI